MGSITGIVLNTHNLPVEDVNLVIVAGPSHPDIAALTDAKGLFSFDNLRPGHYIIKAFGQVASDDIPVQVIRNKTPFVEIWLDLEHPPTGDLNVIGEEHFFTDDSAQREEY
ncbi:carboxypeptidase-like regulatory domain-containing protein [Hymenobacter fodinae]|nr:carboxypeptidase-like regulatory domain-containing protein [Hymenobacter fodinae]